MLPFTPSVLSNEATHYEQGRWQQTRATSNGRTVNKAAYTVNRENLFTAKSTTGQSVSSSSELQLVRVECM
eukprot:15438054-Alexandrium_andersonii.AAC.1